ncbi:MAG: Trk system potassium transporter TrkA [Alistipes sp.]|nr:Trk system potassium transporter TrkA [Candidatus Alistipes equi]
MKIVIAGAGQMGRHLARMLSASNHDITVIDKDSKALAEVAQTADTITIEGDSTSFTVLAQAQTRHCDLFIAVTGVENDNILSAIMAKQVGARKSIARINNLEFLETNNKEMFINMGIDYMFYPEKLAADEVLSLLGHTSTTEYVDFSGGRLSLLVFRLELTSPLVGRQMTSFTREETEKYRTVAISREGTTIIPHGNDILQVGDVLYAVACRDSVDEVLGLSGKSNVTINNVMILGGSKVGVQIAERLQDFASVKLVERNPEKAYRLAEELSHTLILCEDGRNTDVMIEEGLQNMDAFIAVTGRSETNILTAMLAKRLGAKKVIAEVENMNYINLADSVGVDTIVNRKEITVSNIYRFTMSTDVLAIKTLRGSEAQVLEFVVKPNSPATKCQIKDLGLPQDVSIGGVVRADKVFIALGDTRLAAYDRVVVFSMQASISKLGDYFR